MQSSSAGLLPQRCPFQHGSRYRPIELTCPFLATSGETRPAEVLQDEFGHLPPAGAEQVTE
jgi:hypothetical protein